MWVCGWVGGGGRSGFDHIETDFFSGLTGWYEKNGLEGGELTRLQSRTAKEREDREIQRMEKVFLCMIG